MKGTWRILRLIWRTSLVSILGAVVTLTTLLTATALSVNRLYPDDRTRKSYEVIVNSSPATVIFQGRGYDIGTGGGILAQQMAILTLTLFPMVMVWTGVRFTRGMEDKNYFDVITSGTVGRVAPVAAGLLASLSVAVTTALACFIALAVLDYDKVGSARYAILLACAMMAAAAAGTTSSQIFRHSREALLTGFAIVLAFFLLRAWIDLKNYSQVWSNPASWLAEARPFSSSPVWWPLLSYLALLLVLTGVTLFLATRRDLGGGIIAPLEGPAAASPLLSNPVALLVRLTYRTALAVAVGGGVVAFVFGLFAKQMSGQGQLDARLVLIIQLDVLFASAAGVLAASTMAEEERSGRVGRVLAEPVGRTSWSLTGLGVSLAWSLAVLLVCAALTGAGLSLSYRDWSRLAQSLSDAGAYVAPVVFLTCLAMLLGALRPRLVLSTWLLVAWAAIVTLRADMLRLGSAARHFSPLEWMGHVPLAAWDTRAAAVMAVLSLLMAAAALLIFRRRSLVAG
ncbi:hypothetical protein [Luteococcus sp.]|uniref:hypothetical protein n=1 Tax=Luteococcus sp. TaxID=1969402 RepID=UPI00373696F6